MSQPATSSGVGPFSIALVVAVKGTRVQAPFSPQLNHLRGPESLAEVADLVLSIHCDDMFDAESKRPGEADIEVLKHRYGPTHLLPPIAFQGHYARFVEMAS